MNRLTEQQQQDLDNGKAIAIIWQIDDINGQAESMGIDISEEQAIDILYDMDANHDACYGICWDTIDYYLSNYQQAAKVKL